MRFILLLMYFTALPAPPGVKEEDRVWTFQSTTVMEFSTKAACAEIHRSVTASLAKVNTLVVRGWCLCEARGAERCPSDTSPPSMTMQESGGSVGVETLRPPSRR